MTTSNPYAAFFIQYEFFELFLSNPASLKRWRETYQPSQAKDDRMDSFHLADFVFLNHSRLAAWIPDDDQTNQLRTLVESRRSLVDCRPQINNQLKALLKALLKDYFPQALDLTGKYLYARLACAFLTKWPTLHGTESLQTGFHQELLFRPLFPPSRRH